MGKNSTQVLEAWRRGDYARTGNGSFSTRDGLLYSYKLLIGKRTKLWGLIVAGYNAPRGQFMSVTTSTHVNKAADIARLVNVEEFKAIE